MQQQFETAKLNVRKFRSWHESGELLLQPKFQRRDVWSDKARSYLIDTIIRGKPIPKIYMRLLLVPVSKRTIREIVDGQQRLTSVLSFLKDEFKLSKTHNKENGGRYFSGLDPRAQQDILDYSFAVDILDDVPDQEVHDIFARMNTYSTTLNYQELRHAKYFGEFRTSAYNLAFEFMTFWQNNRIFSDKQILRMVEAEFASELLLASEEGIVAGEKRVIDKAYKEYDDRFPNRTLLEKRFAETIDSIGGIFADSLPSSKFRERRLLYPLYCAVYHMRFELPALSKDRRAFKPTDYPKLRETLEHVDGIFLRLREAKERAENQGSEFSDPLNRNERTFFQAYDKHWVHARNRRIMTDYICALMLRALRQ